MAPSNWRREKIEMEFFGATITEFAALTADTRLRHAQTLKLTCPVRAPLRMTGYGPKRTRCGR